MRKHANTGTRKLLVACTFGFSFHSQRLIPLTSLELHVHRNHTNRSESTNQEASRWLKTADPCSIGIFTTNDQFRGKGQRGAKWEQQAGLDLAWSMGIRWSEETIARASQHENTWFALNKSITLATWRTLHALLECPTEDVCIKWPNDLFVSDGQYWRKCGGILIENTWHGTGISGTVVGIGINALSSNLPNVRTSLRQSSDQSNPDDFHPLAVAKLLEENIRKAITNWESALLKSGIPHQTNVLKNAGLEFDQRLLARGKWKDYRWRGRDRTGMIMEVDAQGRCAMNWRDGQESEGIVFIENNKELEWSWINRQFD